MVKNSLSPDELGEKGESRFKEICADAQLICNKSDRDRAGWDFIVDFPFEDQKQLSLDHRVAPSSCHVQVKTILASTASISLKLNMAERLAKELKPSFIFVIKVKEDLTVAESYLIHLVGDRLGSVLKRLRRESANGTSLEELNKKFISFTPRRDERVDCTGQALRGALQKACGKNLHAYVENKTTQLSSLGFDGPRFGGQLVFNAQDQKELGDIFLGIRESVVVENFETFENRFDIKIQDLPPQSVAITIKPEPSDRCKVVVRGTDDLPPAVFEADIFVLPKFVEGGEARAHLRSQLFRMDLFQTAKGVRPHFYFDILGKKASAEVWWNYWRALRAIYNNSGFIEVIPEKTKGVMRFEILRTDETGAYGYDASLQLCEALIRVFRFSGLGPIPEFEWESIESEWQLIVLLDRLTRGSFESFTSSGGLAPGLQELDGRQAIFANRFSIADRWCVYYAVATLKVTHGSENTSLEVSNVVFRRATLVDQNEKEFSDFIDDAKRREEIEVYFSMKANQLSDASNE